MPAFPTVSREQHTGILAQAVARLQPHSETPQLDAQVLLAHVTGRSRAWVLAHPGMALTQAEVIALEEALKRLEAGEPLPYVLGRWEFFGLELVVTPDVLIPRPETELLVEAALDWLATHPQATLAADVGTGSGCIAVALASRAPRLRILAGDISSAALRIAQANLQRCRVAAQALCLQADLLPPAGRPFDLICANLPYIPSLTMLGLRVARWEPPLALDGGADGLDLIRRLLEQAPRALASDGLLLMEIEASQGAAVAALAQAAFPERSVRLSPDLAGLDRLIRVGPAGGE